MVLEEFISSKIKNNSIILCSKNFQNDLKKISNLIIHFETEEHTKYDVIILDNIDFTDSTKTYLKDGGKIVFIVDVITNIFYYTYHPYNCLNSITFGYFKNYEYLEDVYDKLRNNDLKIIDSYRLSTYDVLGLDVVKFGITCILKF